MKKKPTTPCNGHDLPCQNTGTFSWETCSCKCLPPYTGKICEKCIEQKCPRGKVQDPNTCGCMCPPAKQCKNNGVLDDDTCGCTCTNSWHGEQCEKCTPNHVMVMVYGTTSNALACVMRHGSPIRNAKHVAIWNVVYMEHSLKKTAPVDAKATGKVFNAMSARQRKSVSSPALTADCMHGTRKSASARNNANLWTANTVGSKIQRAVSVNAIHKVTAPTLAFLATRSCLRKLPFGQVINAKPANNQTRTHVLVRARSI